jgi:hypothetical protein
MASNRTGGIVQVVDNSVASINQALIQVLNRLDAALGLRGRATVHDRLGVTDPTVDADAVTKGSLDDRETLFHVTLLALGPNGIPALALGTTYSEVGRSLRSRVNFATPAALEGRLIVYAVPSESGTGKGVALYTIDGTQILDVTWDGQGEGVRVGAYTPVTLDADHAVAVYAKGSSATESLILRYVAAEFRLTSGSVVA